jgi:hypothetical protein
LTAPASNDVIPAASKVPQPRSLSLPLPTAENHAPQIDHSTAALPPFTLDNSDDSDYATCRRKRRSRASRPSKARKSLSTPNTVAARLGKLPWSQRESARNRRQRNQHPSLKRMNSILARFSSSIFHTYLQATKKENTVNSLPKRHNTLQLWATSCQTSPRVVYFLT